MCDFFHNVYAFIVVTNIFDIEAWGKLFDKEYYRNESDLGFPTVTNLHDQTIDLVIFT